MSIAIAIAISAADQRASRISIVGFFEILDYRLFERGFFDSSSVLLRSLGHLYLHHPLQPSQYFSTSASIAHCHFKHRTTINLTVLKSQSSETLISLVEVLFFIRSVFSSLLTAAFTGACYSTPSTVERATCAHLFSCSFVIFFSLLATSVALLSLSHSLSLPFPSSVCAVCVCLTLP